MPRLTVEENDTLRRGVWGEFRLPHGEALTRLRADPLSRQEVSDLIARASTTTTLPGETPGGGGGGGGAGSGEELIPLRDRLQVINSETFVISLTGNTALEFRGCGCTSVLPYPSVITQIVMQCHNIQDAVTWMATLVDSDISDSGPGEIIGIPLFDARFPNVGGVLGTYPILGGTLTTNGSRPVTIDTRRLVEQPGKRVALWIETGVITWRATLFVTVGMFDPSVTPADIIRATLPRRKAWQYDAADFDEAQKRRDAARLAEEEDAARRAAAARTTTRAAPAPRQVYAPPAPRATKTVTIQQPAYPRAVALNVTQGGRVLSSREVPWAALSPALKSYWTNNQAAGRTDPTMTAIW